MKATIISTREGAQKSATRHTFVVSFSEARNLGDDKLTNALFASIIAGGNTSYDCTLDLVRLFGALNLLDEVKTNGEYDAAKGLDLAQKTFKTGTTIDNPNFNLFVIPISEASEGKCDSVIVADSQRTLTAYRRAGFFDRETAVQISKAAFASSLASGAFLLPESKPNTQSASNALANALGLSNAAE